MSEAEIVSMLANFQPDEKEIVATIVQRIDRGRKEYGPWEIDTDKRDYKREALEEYLDAAIYRAAETVRELRERDRRIQKVYVCHAFSDDAAGNTNEITFIAKAIVAKGAFPIAPQLYLPAFMDETTQREQALAFCLELLVDCDLVLVFGTPTAGMQREIAFAQSRGIPVRHLRDPEQMS